MKKSAHALLLAWVVGSGCGSDPEHVSYATDVRSIFEPCTSCHRPGAPFGPGTGSGFDILDPYSPVEGLLVANNTSKVDQPELDSPVKLVVPGNPDESFLMDKIADPALGMLPGDQAGAPMPQQFFSPPFLLTEEQKISIETWIRAGATESEQFLREVVPVFGNDGRFAGATTSGLCLSCHFAGTPTPPDLSDPFGANGLVNVRASYRTDLLRVRPFDPQTSFLVKKIRAGQPSSEQGAPMPRSFAPLTAGQVETVRQWIVEGALP